jgi:hypothetical protein
MRNIPIPVDVGRLTFVCVERSSPHTSATLEGRARDVVVSVVVKTPGP